MRCYEKSAYLTVFLLRCAATVTGTKVSVVYKITKHKYMSPDLWVRLGYATYSWSQADEAASIWQSEKTMGHVLALKAVAHISFFFFSLWLLLLSNFSIQYYGYISSRFQNSSNFDSIAFCSGPQNKMEDFPISFTKQQNSCFWTV